MGLKKTNYRLHIIWINLTSPQILCHQQHSRNRLNLTTLALVITFWSILALIKVANGIIEHALDSYLPPKHMV